MSARRVGRGERPKVGDGEPEADPESVARHIILQSLTRRDHTRAELTRKLAEREVPEDAANAVLDRFDDLGLVDDRGFAGRWVQSRQVRRGLSRRALQRELAAKGVGPEVVTEVTGQIDADEEQAIARAVAERKLRALQHLPAEVRARRVAGALARRGFDASVIARALRELAQPTPEVGDSEE